MSKIRPTLNDSDRPGLSYRSTYFRILEATAAVHGLIHGKLHDNGNSCAVGCYFKQADIPINSQAIDEIAAYNDSFPHLSKYERWRKVRKWLRFQITLFGQQSLNKKKT